MKTHKSTTSRWIVSHLGRLYNVNLNTRCNRTLTSVAIGDLNRMPWQEKRQLCKFRNIRFHQLSRKVRLWMWHHFLRVMNCSMFCKRNRKSSVLNKSFQARSTRRWAKIKSWGQSVSNNYGGRSVSTVKSHCQIECNYEANTFLRKPVCENYHLHYPRISKLNLFDCSYLNKSFWQKLSKKNYQ